MDNGKLIPPGYKQTEVGVIPEDWVVKSLGRFVALQRGHDLTERDRRRGEVPVMGSAGLNGFHDTALMRGPGVVLGRSGASFGQAHYCKTDFWPYNTALYVTDFFGNYPLFTFYFLKGTDFSRHNSGGAQQSLNRNFIAPILVAVPRREEQEAIAEALSDADALVESLEQLLAKKRQIKQGAMQELLTGKRRLPGFNGEWEVANLDGVVDRITGVWGASDPSPDHPRCVYIIRAGDISQDGLLTGSAQRFLSDPEFFKAHCRLDDIVITTSGNGLGKVWWCDGQPHVAASNFVRILRPLSGKSHGRYLSYVLRSEKGLKQLQEHTATNAYPNLRPSFFAAVWIPLPPIPEQTAIATILSDMDAEIAALESKLAKARQLKQGMMQELLTGRIRLV